MLSEPGTPPLVLDPTISTFKLSGTRQLIRKRLSFQSPLDESQRSRTIFGPPMFMKMQLMKT